jgi:hypothetical protein
MTRMYCRSLLCAEGWLIRHNSRTNVPSFLSVVLTADPVFMASPSALASSTCIFSPSALSSCVLSASGTAISSSFFSCSFTPSHVGPYSPLKLTPLRSPNGNTPLRNVNIRPQKIVVEPILDSRRSRSFNVRSRIKAFPFCGTMPLVSRVARDSIHENMCEHDVMVWVSRRSWSTVKGKVASHASAEI